jgi:hypothetical protein
MEGKVYLVVTVLATVPKVSNPAKDDGFLSTIKVRLHDFFRRRKPLKIPAEYDRDALPARFTDFIAKFLPASLLGVWLYLPYSCDG